MCDRIFAPGGRLVTAGDGNMVSVGHIGHPRQAPPRSQQRLQNAGSQYWSRRRGRTHVCTHTRSWTASNAGRGCHDVPRGSQDRDAVGEGRQAHVDSHPGRPPAVPGDGGPCAARGYPAASVGVVHAQPRYAAAGRTRACPRPATRGVPHRTARQSASSSSEGGRPRRSLAALGAPFRGRIARAMGRSDVAGVDPVAPENQARRLASVAGSQQAAAAPG